MYFEVRGIEDLLQDFKNKIKTGSKFVTIKSFEKKNKFCCWMGCLCIVATHVSKKDARTKLNKILF